MHEYFREDLKAGLMLHFAKTLQNLRDYWWV